MLEVNRDLLRYLDAIKRKLNEFVCITKNISFYISQCIEMLFFKN